MRPCRAPFAALAVALFAALACGSAAGEPVASFRLPSLDGPELGPPDYRGDVVVVDFWATWCAPCHVQAEILENLRVELEGKGVRFLAVNQGEPEERIRSFLADRPIHYPVLLDPEERLGASLGLLGLPTVAVIDREGGVAYFDVGIVREQRLREILDQAGV